jgi:transposase
MRKSQITITNDEITKERLSELVSGHGPVRIGLRIAIIQGILDHASIEQLSRRHQISRQAIYDLIERVNLLGINGLKEQHRCGRPSKLTAAIEHELKMILTAAPNQLGYQQSRWDGPLIKQYLKEKHNINIGKSQVNVWLHQIGYSLQRGRKKFRQADPVQQAEFIQDIKKTSNSKGR